jgi:uncharacterized damage-inducible protein DinB
MTPEYFRFLFDYNFWARDRLLGHVALLTREEYERPNGFTYGSIRGILVHGLSGEWIWRSRWQDRVNPTTHITVEDIPTLDALVERWAQEETKMREFLGSLTPELLTAHLEYSGTDGQRWSHPLWQLMAHMVNHATNHRSEAAESLTMIGQSPGDLDMTVFIRQRLPALGSG